MDGPDKRQDGPRKAAKVLSSVSYFKIRTLFHLQRAPATQTPAQAVKAFQDATSYGDVFPCLSCSQTFFDCEVVRAVSVQALHLLDGLGRCIAEENLRSSLFKALGQRWICLVCKASLDNGRLPAMSARNGLPVSWARAPPAMLGLSAPERELLTGLNPFLKARLQIYADMLCLCLFSGAQPEGGRGRPWRPLQDHSHCGRSARGPINGGGAAAAGFA